MWWKWRKKATYDVVEYWNQREDPNSKIPNERNTKMHIDFVKSNINKADKILDFGPGVGRILPAYNKNNKITGYDISSKYEERLLKAAGEQKIDLNLIIEDKVLTKFSFKNNEFTTSVSISVLLHQPPEHITNIMCELARIAEKVIIVSWHDPKIPYDSIDEKRDKTKFCFNHNYKEICEKNNLIINSWDYKSEIKQVYLIYGKQ
ncbi:MAG TPA: class I SAM-dependent methyltransferase [Candidatus Poseidoniia archaeon]|jgi:ubiquinone/menaquinone biosynthesis C-methylase UbiE|nr:class I SAM-dependent methyltransferase [Candidatus Poseidoniia archaeon]|tara:strand:+ start:1306 stop:1920 length:615 start_codon:yes stop_codon:yes gene_type:complete